MIDIKLIRRKKAGAGLNNAGNNGASVNLSGIYSALEQKLDRAVFEDMFEKVNIGTEEEPKYAIRAKYGLYTESFLSCLGLNQSEGVAGGGGINETQLAEYLTSNNYAKKTDIPSLSGYATETWVQNRGYLTSSSLSGYATETWVQNRGYATETWVQNQGYLKTHQSLANYVTLNTSQSISGIKTFLRDCWVLWGNENSEITNKIWGNGVWTKDNNPASNYYAVRNSLSFRWYNEYWGIGNIRGSSTGSYGFGIFHEDSTGTYQRPCFRVADEGSYVNEQIVMHAGNIGSYNAGSATKLQKAVNLWGQSFDGTKDITDKLTIFGGRANILIGGTVASWNGTNYPAIVSDNVDKWVMFCNPHIFLNKDGYSLIRMESTSGVGLDIRANSTGMHFGDSNGNFAMSVLKSNGNVGIGTSAPSYKLHVSGVIFATTGIFSNGYVSCLGQNSSSDERLKDVISDLYLDIHTIANAPSVLFKWKKNGKEDVGTIAQYWQPILPFVVNKDPDGFYGLDYGKTALLSAISIARKVESLEERVERLEKNKGG